MKPDGYANPEANDIRFQYEVIKNLADSVREQSKVMAGIQATQVSMLERLARIEANRVNEVVAEVKAIVGGHTEKIDKLESLRDIAEGGVRTRRAVQSYWGIIVAAVSGLGMLFWILFRATGIVHLPTDEKPPIIVPMDRPRDTLPPEHEVPR